MSDLNDALSLLLDTFGRGMTPTKPTPPMKGTPMSIRTKDSPDALAAERARLEAELARVDAAAAAEERKKRDAELAVERAARLATEERRARNEASAQLIEHTKLVARLLHAVEQADENVRRDFIDALRQLFAAAQ